MLQDMPLPEFGVMDDLSASQIRLEQVTSGKAISTPHAHVRDHEIHTPSAEPASNYEEQYSLPTTSRPPVAQIVPGTNPPNYDFTNPRWFEDYYIEYDESLLSETETAGSTENQSTYPEAAEPFSRDNTPGNKVQIETDSNLTHVDITRNPHSWRPSPDANSCLEDWREFHFVRSPCGSNLRLTINYRDHTGSEKDLALEFSLLDEIKDAFDKLFEAKVNIPHHSSTVKDTPDVRTDIAHMSIQESTPSVDNVRITLDPNDTIPSLPCKRDSNSMAGSSISLRSEKKIGASTADKRSKRKAGSSSEFRYQSLDRAIKRPHVQEARAGEKRCKTSHS
ncbi:uncharacterized protein K489DRAFT_151 [Dissoconium aciculare CBS 342.82]|uniref:Uncharacterized protein n=1 Tax=Dissoconium aciculare CBS 342.82 TaxID=1314786 RepID=A0A6J3MFW0_9PEZI|nr:uncharacterized protein K489DRAFT_151 [Dissoconium aciculare CBS 342.82]KAF1826855.1 hypothetical protein K489DRAFT_151 [Dissoconium aciculare CBS 342.82]